MLKRILLAAGLLLAALPADASSPDQFIPLGYQQTTVSSTAISLPSIPAGARYASVVIETAGIRWRDDQVAPTASIGMPVPANGTVQFQNTLSQVQIIAQSGTATVDVSYYK